MRLDRDMIEVDRPLLARRIMRQWRCGDLRWHVGDATILRIWEVTPRPRFRDSFPSSIRLLSPVRHEVDTRLC